MIEETSIAMAEGMAEKQEQLIRDAISLRCEDLGYEIGEKKECRLRAERSIESGITSYYMDDYLILEMEDEEYEMCDGKLIGSQKYRIHCGDVEDD